MAQYFPSMVKVQNSIPSTAKSGGGLYEKTCMGCMQIYNIFCEGDLQEILRDEVAAAAAATTIIIMNYYYQKKARLDALFKLPCPALQSVAQR